MVSTGPALLPPRLQNCKAKIIQRQQSRSIWKLVCSYSGGSNVTNPLPLNRALIHLHVRHRRHPRYIPTTILCSCTALAVWRIRYICRRGSNVTNVMNPARNVLHPRHRRHPGYIQIFIQHRQGTLAFTYKIWRGQGIYALHRRTGRNEERRLFGNPVHLFCNHPFIRSSSAYSISILIHRLL